MGLFRGREVIFRYGSYHVLGGAWVVISGVISRLIWVLSIVTLLVSPLITTQEPPSRVCMKGQKPGTYTVQRSTHSQGSEEHRLRV